MNSLLPASPISSADYAELVRPLACRRLDVFYNHVFRDGIEVIEGRFIPARHVDEWCRWVQQHRKTSLVSARKFLKSTRLYAKVAWRLFQMLYAEQAPRFFEGLYMSYSEELSGYHLEKAKRYIEACQWLKPLVPLTDAKSIIHYANHTDKQHPGYREVRYDPSGIMTFKRGRHGDEVICDDILRDPEVRLDLSQIEKISSSFFDQVASIPKEGVGELHVAGTPQDKDDLFSRLRGMASFASQEQPAWEREEAGCELWPELFPLERLREIRDKEIGKKSFLKEYLCRPVREVSGYLEDGEVDAVIDRSLVAMRIGELVPGARYVMGLDLGKKTHPSHMSVFEIMPGPDGEDELVQRISRWFDQTDYIQQVEVITSFDRLHDLTGFAYDDTRAELESFKERKELPTCAEGVPFSVKMKFESAARLGMFVRKKRVRLLADPRQRRSLLAVDDNLDAPENADGHADAFWSMALALHAYEGRPPAALHVVEEDRPRADEDD